MPRKASTTPARSRAARKPAAKPLAVAPRKRAARRPAKNGGFHIGKYAVIAGIAAAAAALAFLPDTVTGEVKKQVKDKSRKARASVGEAEKMMKDAIEAARSYASKAMH